MHGKMQKARVMQHFPPQPGNVPLLVQYGNSTGTTFFKKLLEIGTKKCLRIREKIILLLKMLKVAAAA